MLTLKLFHAENVIRLGKSLLNYLFSTSDTPVIAERISTKYNVDGILTVRLGHYLIIKVMC